MSCASSESQCSSLLLIGVQTLHASWYRRTRPPPGGVVVPAPGVKRRGPARGAAERGGRGAPPGRGVVAVRRVAAYSRRTERGSCAPPPHLGPFPRRRQPRLAPNHAPPDAAPPPRALPDHHPQTRPRRAQGAVLHQAPRGDGVCPLRGRLPPRLHPLFPPAVNS